MKKKEEVYSFPQQKDGAVVETDIRMIPLEELQDFEGHPFKVENDMALFELMLSIEKEGVIVPALARPKADGGYELIAGHRRKVACKWAGLDMHMTGTVPNSMSGNMQNTIFNTTQGNVSSNESTNVTEEAEVSSNELEADISAEMDNSTKSALGSLFDMDDE